MPQTKNDKRRKALAMREHDIEVRRRVMSDPSTPDVVCAWAARTIAEMWNEIERIQANIAKTPETKR